MTDTLAILALSVRALNTAFLTALFVFMTDATNFDRDTAYNIYIEVYTIIYIIIEAVGFLLSVMISVGWMEIFTRRNTISCIMFLIVALANYAFLIAVAVFMLNDDNFSEASSVVYRYTLGIYAGVAVIMNCVVSEIRCTDREQTCLFAIV